MRTILFSDGTTVRKQVYLYNGACFAGDPTAYVIRFGKTVWVSPGKSVDFIEANHDAVVENIGTAL